MGVGGKRHTLVAIPPGRMRHLLYRLGVPQGRSGQVRKISLLTGIPSPELPARSELLSRPYIYHAPGIPVEIQAQTHWNLIGQSMTTPPRVLSPSIILPPPSSRCTLIPAKEIGSRLKSIQFEREIWKSGHSLTILFGSRYQCRR